MVFSPPNPPDDPLRYGLDPEMVLPVLVRQRSSDMPDATFLQEIISGREETYSQTHAAALRWADALEALGVERGDSIAGLLPPCLEAHHAWIGAGWLGACNVPLNTEYRGRMLRYTLDDSGAAVLVTTSALLTRVAEVAGELTALRVVVVADGNVPDDAASSFEGTPVTRLVGRDELLDNRRESAAERSAPLPGDLACVLYTSGTTGPSKGVKVRWAELASGVHVAPPASFAPGDGYYDPYPIYHVTGLVPLIAMAAAGGRVVFRPSFSSSAFWDDISTYRCKAMVMMGSIANFVMSRPPSAADADCPLEMVTMAPAVPNVEEFKARFGLEVMTSYGMTEIGWPVVNYEVDSTNYQSCGRLRTGYHLRVVDPDGVDVDAGIIGELLVRCDDERLMNAGYLNLPEATAEAWAGGWFHTGDAFRCDTEGRYYFVDRIKDAIRRRGENISSFEVEGYVNEHPDVADCAAIAVPADELEDEVKVVAVLRPGSTTTARELLEWLAPRMPRFMVPRYVEVVTDLPRTETGKVRKIQLRDAGVTGTTVDREALGIERSSR